MLIYVLPKSYQKNTIKAVKFQDQKRAMKLIPLINY